MSSVSESPFAKSLPDNENTSSGYVTSSDLYDWLISPPESGTWILIKVCELVEPFVDASFRGSTRACFNDLSLSSHTPQSGKAVLAAGCLV